jgi:hypothetical protein
MKHQCWHDLQTVRKVVLHGTQISGSSGGLAGGREHVQRKVGRCPSTLTSGQMHTLTRP